MADRISEARRSYNMSRIRSRDTAPEMMLRRELHARGLRYRLYGRQLPGKPDIVLTGRRKAVFIHGCFWHQHPSSECLDSRIPKSRIDYWKPKLERNTARDREHIERLSEMGWHTKIVWQCQIEKNLPAVADSVESFLKSAQPPPPATPR